MMPSETVSRPRGGGSKRTSAAGGSRPASAENRKAGHVAIPERPKARERLVRDLMTEKVFTLRPKDNLATLYDLMDSRRVRHVPIVDAEGEIVGLVTDRDLSRSALGAIEEMPLSVERDVLRLRKVRDIMSTEPDTIEPDATLKDAAEILLENKIGCLPVVEGLHLVGILTEADFVRDYLERA